jgi:hypothetical protein
MGGTIGIKAHKTMYTILNTGHIIVQGILVGGDLMHGLMQWT